MKKQVKENPMFKESKKVKKFKSTGITNSTEEGNEIKTFIIIITIIVVLIGAVYGVTELLKKKDNEPESKITEGKIDYDKISVGTMLNRPYDEYYVMVYDSSKTEAVLYSTILSQYSQKEKGLKIYYCDLDNKLNAPYYNVNNDGKSNSKAKTISELNFGELTLIKVKNGKINNYIEDFDKIKETLK